MMLTAVLIGALVLVCAALCLWERTAGVFPVAAALISTALSRYSIEIGVTVRPEHIVAAGLLLGLAARGLFKPRLLVPSPAEVLLAAWIALSLLSSLLFAPDRLDSVRNIGMFVLAASLYVTVRRSLTSPRAVSWAVGAFLAVSALVGAAAIVARAAYETGAPWGVQMDYQSKMPMVFSTQYEANILGSYLASAAIISLFFVARMPKPRRAGLVWCALFLQVAGLALSVSRGPWLGLFAAMSLLVLVWKRGYAPLDRKRFFIGSTLIVLLAVSSLWIPERFLRADRAPGDRPRAAARSTAARSTAARSTAAKSTAAKSTGADKIGGLMNIRVRLRILDEALGDWRSRPLLGKGSGSFGQKAVLKGGAKAWIPNLEIRVLHDTGIIGFLLFGAFFAAFFFPLLRALERIKRGFGSAALVPALLAVVSLLVAYQFSDAMILGHVWVLMAILGASPGNGAARAEGGRSEVLRFARDGQDGGGPRL